MHENIKISDISPLNTDIDTSKVITQSLSWPATAAQQLPIDVLRLDLLHPVISGNKWFKLQYHLRNAMAQGKKGLLTFGGAWSNHLVATAATARLAALSAIGIVRGDKPAHASFTLQDAMDYGMELQFIARTAYADETALVNEMQKKYPDYLIVPAGGQSPAGVQGAAEILSLLPHQQYTHIACAVGTGTMMAGLLQASLPHQSVIGFSSLKFPDREHNSILDFLRQQSPHSNFQLIYDYHFGGYAKKNAALIASMNRLYEQYQLPTDLVYTGKLFYGLSDLVEKNYFPANSRLLVIHSGGLQGNRSLAPGILRF